MVDANGRAGGVRIGTAAPRREAPTEGDSSTGGGNSTTVCCRCAWSACDDDAEESDTVSMIRAQLGVATVSEFGADTNDSVDVDDDDDEVDEDDARCLLCDRSACFASVAIWRCADAGLE